ncbi:MAG: tRNA 2-thiocytidine(32) synthetase TtcA, partial [Clostridia bacterium]|nr:tRNA 2-thiocytidine(32) synthetase TtcA [Clostridia bacterium]
MGLKRLLSYARRACDDYNMIEEGDVIAVGVSAGKDSLSLLYTLSALSRFYPKKFRLIAITVDMEFDELGGGRPKADYTPIENLCRELGVEYFVEESHIAKIVFDIRKEKS